MIGQSHPVHLTSVIGTSDLDLLPHFVGHYRGLGITSLRLVLNAASGADPGYAAAIGLARDLGFTFTHVHFGQWTLDNGQRLFRYILDGDRDAWYIVADVDEFQVYDRPPADLIRLCEDGGFDHVNGCFLDRVAADGGFPPPGPGPLWATYPLAGAVSAVMAGALPLKACLVRGSVELLPAQHGAASGRGVPRSSAFVQVHHFKWRAGVLDRLRGRVDRYRDDPEHGERWASLEAARFLSAIGATGGRIDVTDESLWMHRCRDSFSDHLRWADIADHAAGWQWAIRY